MEFKMNPYTVYWYKQSPWTTAMVENAVKKNILIAAEAEEIMK